MRKNISTGSEWEEAVGYSRAVRIGDVVEVAGTVAAGEGLVIENSDEYQQAKFILKKIENALEEAGASLVDVVRTRIYVKDITNWNKIAKAHQEVFGKIKPVTSMIEVKNLISPEYLVEIEASAIVNNKQ